MKKIVIVLGLLIVLGLSYGLNIMAQNQSSYQGLSTVPCLDYTEPVVRKFSFSLKITIGGRDYPLAEDIGHDYGNCLHYVHTHDASGTVYVESNDDSKLTLGQFFDVWGGTFTDKQLFSYRVDQNHQIKVVVNGEQVGTYRETILHPNDKIMVIYE